MKDEAGVERPDDPLRALDQVNPPDRWREIVDRAAAGSDATTAPVDGSLSGTRTRRAYLAAAAVLAVVAAAAGLALANRGDDDTELVAGDRSTVTAEPDDRQLDPPGEIVNRTWNLVSFVRDGTELVVPDPPEGGTRPTLTVGFSPSERTVSFRACNLAGAPGGVSGNRLALEAGMDGSTRTQWTSTLMACAGAEGEALMALDDAVRSLIVEGPIIELSGGRLTLRSGGDVGEFTDPDWPHGDPDEIPVVDGVDWVVTDSPCLLGRKVDALTTGWDWYEVMAPGPASPPVVQSAPPPRNVERQGVWSIAVGGSRVEVHVPGLMVIDLVGERTEEVDIGRAVPATLWFTDSWVQLRYFPGGTEGGRCESFTVTVTGADEGTNRAGAITVATSLVTADREA